jgi:PAS domain S-box-containing protein
VDRCSKGIYALIYGAFTLGALSLVALGVEPLLLASEDLRYLHRNTRNFTGLSQSKRCGTNATTSLRHPPQHPFRAIFFRCMMAGRGRGSQIQKLEFTIPKRFLARHIDKSARRRIFAPQVILMAQVKPSVEGILEQRFVDSKTSIGQHSSHVQPVYMTVVNTRRQFVEVSPSFCKLLGYAEEELIGRSYDEVTAPHTNNIPSVLQLFLQSGHMDGIWVFKHRGGTKLFVRYEASLRKDGFYESRMELLAAGA